MKKLLTIALLLGVSSSVFGAASKLQQMATIGKVFITAPRTFTNALADYYRNQNIIKHNTLKMAVKREWTIKRINTLEKETGLTAEQATNTFKPQPSLLGTNSTIDPLIHLRMKQLESLSKKEQLAILHSNLTQLPDLPAINKVMSKHSPLLKTGLLAQISGTNEYKNEKIYPHIANLIKGSKVENLLNPEPVKFFWE